MANLPQSGVQLVAQGESAFFAALNKGRAGLGDLGEAAQKSAAKVATLSNTLDKQERELAILQRELAQVSAKYGESSTQADRKRLAVDKLGDSVTRTKADLAAERATLEQLNASQAEAARSADKLETETKQAGDAADRTGKQVLQAGNDIRRAGDGFNAFGEIAIGALRRVGEIALQIGADIARAIGRGIGDSISTAGDFQQILSVLGATSGATASELEQIRQKAIDLGADLTLPTTSASNAAEVMLELSKAGMSVEEAMAAAQGTLQLAAAAQIDEATAAQIAAGALNAFELAATDANRVADLLAAGANASSASMTDLSQGLQQAGFAFNAAGLPIEDLITSLAALTNVGLTGSDAGTALKNALMRLMDPTDKAAKLMASLGFSAYDAQGNMKQLPQIIADLNKAFAGMTQEERNAALGNIFLSDGMKAMIPLLDLNEAGFLALKEQVTEEGAAASVAAAQTQGWNGALAGLGSQVETAQLLLGERLLPILTPLVQQLGAGVAVVSEFTNRFFDLVPEIANSSDQLNKFFAVLRLLLPEFGSAIDATQNIANVLRGALAQALAFIEPYIVQLGNAWTNTVIPALQTAWNFFNAQIVPILQNLATAVLPLIPAALQIVASFWTNVLVPALQTAWAFFTTAIIPVLADVAAWLATNLPPAIQATSNFISNTLLPAAKSIYDFLQTNVIPVLADVATWLRTNVPVAIQAATTFFNTKLLPAITAIYDFFTQKVIPTLTEVARVLKEVVGTAVTTLAGFWKDTLQPAIQNVVTIITGAATTAFNGLKPVLETVQGVVGSVAGAFNGIASAIQGAIDKVKAFIDAASKVKVPKLITPGSPTPLETGLVGIASAMDEVISRGASFGDALGGMLGSADTTAGAISDAVNDLMKGKDKNEDKGGGDILGFGNVPTAPIAVSIPDTPDFWSKIVTAGIAGGVPQLAPPAPAPAPAPAPTRDMSIQPVTNYNMPIYTNQSPTVLQHSLDVARALAR